MPYQVERHTGGGFALAVYLHDARGSQVGTIGLGLTRPSELFYGCRRNVELLAATLGIRTPPVYFVWDVVLDEELQGRGHGSALYRRAFEEIPGSIVVPGFCHELSGSTSWEAQLVWDSLRRDYQFVGNGEETAIYIPRR